MKVRKTNYKTFLNYLNKVNPIFTDLEINDNVIRQKTDGNLGILESNISTLFPESVNMRLALLKVKLPLFDIFTKTDSEEIDIEIDDKIIKVSDDYSDVTIGQAKVEYLSNRYMNETEVSNKINIDWNSESIATYTIPEMLIKRIGTIANHLNAITLSANISNSQMDFQIIGSDKVNNSKPLKNIPVNYNDELRIHFTIYPFQISYDGDIKINLGIKQLQNGKLNAIMAIDSSIEGIETKIYLKGSVIA